MNQIEDMRAALHARAPVWKRLGFDDPDRFAIATMRENLSPESVNKLGVARTVIEVRKRTGRTYRMLFEALEAIARGQKIGLRFAKLERGQHAAIQVQAWTDQLEMGAVRVEVATRNDSDRVRGLGVDVWFTDHAAGGPDLE